MSGTDIQKRRQIRELESKRDRLLEGTTKNKRDLTKVRAELKHLKAKRK